MLFFMADCNSLPYCLPARYQLFRNALLNMFWSCYYRLPNNYSTCLMTYRSATLIIQLNSNDNREVLRVRYCLRLDWWWSLILSIRPKPDNFATQSEVNRKKKKKYKRMIHLLESISAFNFPGLFWNLNEISVEWHEYCGYFLWNFHH